MAQHLKNLSTTLTAVFFLLAIAPAFGQIQNQFQLIEATARPLFQPTNRIIWSTPGRLTLSFAADGTDIAGHKSTLMTSFASISTPSEIEDVIIEAFQQWAELSSINVGLVDDNIAVPFGTSGPTQTNLSVGDIRVGAVPMTNDVFAVAVPHNELLSGGWSGTLLFNSNAQFESAEQFFAVALHEAGHVFGLEHTYNTNAVMHPTALNVVFDPEDIEGIQSLYGERELDQYDLGSLSNNTMDLAEEVENGGSIDGAVPTITFGDIGGADDVDYFCIETRSDYVGSFTVTLTNREISVADLKLTVTDENGIQYGEMVGSGSRGDELQIVVNNADIDLDYFVRIELAASSKFSTGSYALITTFDSNLQPTSLDYIQTIVRRNYNFVDQEQVQELFCEDEPFCDGLLDLGLNDELLGPSNDTFETATTLVPLAEFAENNRFRVQGSLQTDIVDLDHYRVTSPSECTNLVVELTALGVGGPITRITLFDAAQNEVEGRIFVNGNGELLIQYLDVTPSTNYVVKVEADDPDVFGTGNYQLDMTFCAPPITVNNLAAGILSPANRIGEHSLYVARSQLFHFAIRNDLIGNTIPPAMSNSTIWMSIFDEEGNPVHRIATPLGDIRSSRSVVLRPGSYAVRISVSTPGDWKSTRPFKQLPSYRIQYVVEGDGISEPTGPEVIDAADDPFAPCDKISSDFCYPNNMMTSDPFIFVDDDGFEPSNPPQNPDWQDANIWYWLPNWLG